MAVDYLNPDYDLWGRQATDRVNGVYGGYEDQINALHRQTLNYNAQTSAALNRDLMQRYADLQNQQRIGSADLAGQGIQQHPYANHQMQALQNAANAQNTYQSQQAQMYENLNNDRLAGVGRMRSAFQSGISADVYAAKAAAAQAAAQARASGGGGGGGSSSSGAPSDSDVMARWKMLNAGRGKVERGIDWLKSNYGNVSSPAVRAAYRSLLKTRGASAQQLFSQYGQTRRMKNAKGELLTKTEPVNPILYKMLSDFIAQRNRYHDSIASTPFTINDAYQSIIAEGM